MTTPVTSSVAPRPEHLVVVTNVVHYRHDGRLHAYVPYSREMAVWATLFPRLTLAAPCRDTVPPHDTAPLPDGISIARQTEVGGSGLRNKAALVGGLPLMIWRLWRAMRQADAVHVRCPGNLGLLGALIAPVVTRRRVAKYAGQWGSYPGEARTVRLQRAILRSRWWGSPTLVYGAAPDDPSQVVSFFSAALTEEQAAHAARVAARAARAASTRRVAYVGRLSSAKNVDVLLRALAVVRTEGLAATCEIIGDGPERDRLERLAADLRLTDAVTFVGALPFERVLDLYARIRVLVLASETEGWPKVIAEAMAFGVTCIGPDRGAAPAMLADGRGLVVPPSDVDALAAALRAVLREPSAYGGVRAATWARRFTLEGFEAALRAVLAEWWDAPARRAVMGRAARRRIRSEVAT